MLKRDEKGKYLNIPEADAFLDKNKQGYVGGLLEMMNERLYGGIYYISNCARHLCNCFKVRVIISVTSIIVNIELLQIG